MDFGSLFDLDFFGGGDYGMGAAESAAASIPDIAPQAASSIGDFSSYIEPALTTFGSGGAGGGSLPWYENLLSGGSNFASMAGDILGNQTFQRFALPAATVGLGSVLGSQAGKSIEKKFKPTPQQQAVEQNIYNQPIDFGQLAAQMSQLMSPQIQESLDRERQAAGGILNRQAMNPSYSSATKEAIGRQQASTDRGIASAISQAVTGARNANLGAQTDVLNRQTAQRGLGVNTALQGAQQAGQAPIQALMLSQLMQMLQQQGRGRPAPSGSV